MLPGILAYTCSIQYPVYCQRLYNMPRCLCSNCIAFLSRIYVKIATIIFGQGDERVAKLFDSPSMPEAECSFKITNGGITDTD